MKKAALLIGTFMLFAQIHADNGKIIGPLKPQQKTSEATSVTKEERAKKLLAQVAEQQKQIQDLQDQVYQLQMEGDAALRMMIRELQIQISELQTQVDELEQHLATKSK